MRTGLWALCSLALTACAHSPHFCPLFDTCPEWTDDPAIGHFTTHSKVVPLPVAKLGNHLQKGDQVRIETRKGSRHRFRIKDVRPDSFIGWASNDKLYRVPYGTISKLGVIRRKSGEDYNNDIIYNVIFGPY